MPSKNHRTHRSMMDRRQFLRATGTLSAGFFFGSCLGSYAARGIEVLETKVISRQPAYYHGWATVARSRSGKLFVVYSGGREHHVCPFGRVEMMVSHDQGLTWSWPRTLLDSPIDDRDAGIMETSKGTLLVTSFTSLAYESSLQNAIRSRAWPKERLNAWQAAHERVSAGERKSELGVWMIRSIDQGVTWSARYSSIVNSPHGPIQSDDGRLLYPGVDLWSGKSRVGVCESVDDGQTWRWLAHIPVRPGDDLREYHELHGVDLGKGRVIVHIRNHNKQSFLETLQAESNDGGRTWTEPYTIGVWGHPSFLCRLRDGSLLMTYGYRRSPMMGNHARLSTDQGKTWSEPLIISGDGIKDLGYPSTVELEDGTLLTIWYEAVTGYSKAVLRQARWRLHK